jgi:hypothetical protein
VKFIKKFNKDSIPLIIGIFLILISSIVSLTTNYSLTQEIIFGFIAFGISLFCYLKDIKIYVCTFLITLSLGLFNIINIFIFQFKFSFGIGDSLNIEINPIFILLLILFFAFNKKAINETFPEKND